MAPLMAKALSGGTSSIRESYNTPGLTSLRSCTRITFKFPILLWLIRHHGMFIQFIAGSSNRPIMFPSFHSSLFSFLNYHSLTPSVIPAFRISSNIIVQGLTILAPVTSPNTDGINPGKFTET